MWGKSRISHINHTGIAQLAEESWKLRVSRRATIRWWPPACSRSLLPFFQWASDEWNNSTCNPPNSEPLAGLRPAPPLPLGKRPPSAAIITGKEKRKPIQTLDGRTNHNLSHPYIWHLLLIPIRRGPSSLHICHLLSPHLWYGYLKIEKCYTFCFPRLLLPSWLMYPKAFLHFLKLGQIFNAIHPWNFFYILTFITRIEWQTWAICIGDQLEEWEGSCIQKYHHRFLATKFCIVLIFFFKMNIISCCLEKKIIRNEIFWVTFTRRLFLAVADKQIIYFIFERF